MAENRQRGLLKLATGLNATAGPARRQIGAPGDAGGAAAASTAAAAIGSVASGFEKLGSVIGSYADHAAAVEGTAAGRIAGIDPEFRPGRSPTIRGEAFDRAGLETHRAQVIAEIERDIDAGGDLEAKRQAWIGSVPHELAPEVQARFQSGMLAQSREAARAEAARIEGEARASLHNEVDATVKGLHQRAFSLGLDPQSDQVLAKQIGLLESALKRTGPDGKPLVAPERAAKLLTDARETVADARLLGAFDRLGSPAAKAAFVQKLEDDFKASKGIAKVYDLAGFQRIMGRLGAEMRSARAAGDIATKALVDDIKAMSKMAEKGFAPTADQLAGLKARTLAAGDPAIVQRLAVLEDVANLQTAARRAPPEEVEAFAVAERRRMAKDGPSEHGVARVEMAEKLAREMRTALAADPLGWANRVGLVKVTPLDLSSDESAAATLKARMVQAEHIGQHYRQEPKYLTPDEKRKLAAAMSSGGGALMGMAGLVSEAAGERAHKVFRELGTEAPTVALIGGHVHTAGPTPVTQDASDGIALTKTDGFKGVAPAGPAARTLAVGAHQGVLGGLPETEQALIAMTNAAYEVRARRRGLTELDTGLWQQTFREALGERTVNGEVYGGIGASKPGGWFTSARGRVVVPPNVKQAGLPDLIAAIRPEDFGEAGPRYGDGRAASAADLRRAALVQAGHGRYWLNVGSDDDPRWLRGAGDKRFVLDLTALETALRARRPDLYLGGGAPAAGDGLEGTN